MLTERKLTERELESREVVLRGLLDNKQNLVKKYGKDAEKVMYGIATKKAKSKVESMNKEKIKELIVQSLTKEAAVTSVEDVIDPADYGLIGAGYLAGFGKKHSLNADQLEELGRKIVKQLYKGDFKAAKAKFIKEDNDPSGADLEGDPNEYVVGEGHGLGQEDLDILKRLLKVGEGDFLQPAEARVLKFLIKSNILQDKTKDLSKGKVNEDVDTFEVDNAIGELGDIIRDIDDKADEAREIVRQVFPQELSRLDAYGAFNMTYSNNRYDVTLGRFVERLEEEGYEIEDGEVYVNEGKKKKMKLPSGMVSYMDFVEQIYERLAKRNRDGSKNEFAPGGKYFLPDDGYMAAKLRADDGYFNPRNDTDASGDTAEDDAEFAIKNQMGVKDPEKIKKFIDGWMKYNQEVLDGTTKYVEPTPDPNRFFQKKRRSNPGKNPRYGKKTNALIQKLKAKRGVDEKLTKKSDVGDFVDDFKKSDAKQFKGKSDKKKKEMAVAAYLAKQND